MLALPAVFAAWVLLLLVAAPWPAVVLAAASHVVFAACALALAPRGRTTIWCGLVTLSLAHFAAWAGMGFAHLQTVAVVYATVAALGLAGLGMGWRRNNAHWHRLAGCTTRDDFRWLVLHAPLPWRWRALRCLARRASG